MKRLTILLSAAALMLTGATMTSCVKNDESQSVTNIRDAKAIQLLALAELSSAQAEAALIAANADKVLKESEAAINKAKAALEQATADGKQVEVEKAKLELERLKAIQQLTIDQLIADAEAAKQKSLQDLKDFMDKLKVGNAENKVLKGLSGKYATELATWHAAVNNLITVKKALSATKLDLKDAKAAKEAVIATENANLIKYNAQLEAVKKINGADKAEAQKQLAAAAAAEDVAKDKNKATAAPVLKAEGALKTLFNAYGSAKVIADFATNAGIVNGAEADDIIFETKKVAVYDFEYTINGTLTKTSQAGENDYVFIKTFETTKIEALKTKVGTTDAVKAACTYVLDNKAAYEKLINDAKPAEVELQKARSLATIAGAEEGRATDVVAELKAIVDGFTDVEGRIEALTALIVTSEKKIADLSSIETVEQLIAYFEVQIVDTEREMAISQAQLDSIKAAIEVELKK